MTPDHELLLREAAKEMERGIIVRDLEDMALKKFGESDAGAEWYLHQRAKGLLVIFKEKADMWKPMVQRIDGRAYGYWFPMIGLLLFIGWITSSKGGPWNWWLLAALIPLVVFVSWVDALLVDPIKEIAKNIDAVFRKNAKDPMKSLEEISWNSYAVGLSRIQYAMTEKKARSIFDVAEIVLRAEWLTWRPPELQRTDEMDPVTFARYCRPDSPPVPKMPYDRWRARLRNELQKLGWSAQ